MIRQSCFHLTVRNCFNKSDACIAVRIIIDDYNSNSHYKVCDVRAVSPARGEDNLFHEHYF